MELHVYSKEQLLMERVCGDVQKAPSCWDQGSVTSVQSICSELVKKTANFYNQNYG